MPSIEVDPEYLRLTERPGAVRWTMALTGAIDYVSPTVEQMRGFTPAEAMAQQGDEIHPPESLRRSLAFFERFSRDLLEGREPSIFRDRLEYTCKDGGSVWCDVVAGAVLGDGGAVLELRGVSAPLVES